MSDGDAASIQLRPGAVFAGDYRVVRPLRSGGQGAIYVVEQLSTSKHRALKLMLPELVAQPTSRKRFELEARIAARIQSDHVVESIASGVDSQTGVPWLVMELLEGEDLAAHVQRRRRLPPGEVLEIFGQLCHALGEAHKQGIVHRDLKPENIFLSTSRRRGMPFMIKVLDFGIARVLAEAKTTSGQTVTGLGTPMWMAPEQTEPGGRIEPCTDVWPLGLLAFRMLTGHLFWKAPYDPAASVLMLMAEAFMHPMPTASVRAAEYKCAERIPPGFDAWFARCVARDMDARHRDAAAAFAELEPLLASVVEPAAPSAPVSLAASSADLKGATTGPGRATWEGAPELGASAVLSADGPSAPSPAEATGASSQAVPPAPPSRPSLPISAAPRPSGAGLAVADAPLRPGPPSTRADAVAPPGGPRLGTRASTLAFAVGVGGLAFAVGVFALGRGGGRPRAVTSPVAASVDAPPPPPAPAPPAVRSATPEATAPASAEPVASGVPEAVAAPSASSPAPAESASAAPSAAVAGKRTRRLCKPAGQKCFSNDDCCDRTCRQWTCRENAALHDPYGGH